MKQIQPSSKHEYLNGKLFAVRVLWMSYNNIIHWTDGNQTRFALFLSNMCTIPIRFFFDTLIWNVCKTIQHQLWISTLSGNGAYISRTLHFILILHTNLSTHCICERNKSNGIYSSSITKNSVFFFFFFESHEKWIRHEMKCDC